MPFRSTTVKDKDIFFVDDKEIGLREVALGSAIPTDPGKATVSGKTTMQYHLEVHLGPRGVLLYISYMGMCRTLGYGF